VTEPGTEGSVVDRTANLEQEIGASSGPSHLWLTANIQDAAKKIVWGAMAWGGQ
jgi:hypothetical protein